MEKEKPKTKPKPKLTEEQLDNLLENQAEELKGERYYARKFASVFSIRKLLLELNRARQGKKHGKNTISNETAYKMAITKISEVLESVDNGLDLEDE